MYNQPVRTWVDTISRLIEQEAALVYWIFIEVNAVGTLSSLKIFDGTSARGKEVARLIVADSRVNPFYPPIRCDKGIYIEKDDKVISYTIGYLSEKVAKGQQF